MMPRIRYLSLFAMLAASGGCADKPIPSGPIAVRPFAGQPGGDDPNTLPIAEVATTSTNSAAVTLAGKSSMPEIVVVAQQTGNSSVAVGLLLINPFDVPIRYHGYRMDAWTERPAVGAISPWYDLKVQDKADEPWKSGNIGFCGNGGGIMVVRPKEAGRFGVEIPLTALAARVGVTCTWSLQGVETKQEILSPVISCAPSPVPVDCGVQQPTSR